MTNSDALFRVKVGERLFVLDRFTLGDWRLLKTEFGLNASDVYASAPDGKGGTFEFLNMNNPSTLVALVTIAQHHDEPTRPLTAVIAEVESYAFDDLDFPDLKTVDEATEKPDPTQEGDSEATAAPSSSGSPASRRKSSGTPRTPKS